MSIINKEISEFKTYAYHENDFKTVSKEDILGKWSVFFYPWTLQCCRTGTTD